MVKLAGFSCIAASKSASAVATTIDNLKRILLLCATHYLRRYKRETDKNDFLMIR